MKSFKEMVEEYKGKHPDKVKTVYFSGGKHAYAKTNSGQMYKLNHAKLNGKLPEIGDHLITKHHELKEEIDLKEETLDEVLTKDTAAGKWIDDFVKSDNPKFAGKSPEKRKQMALAAYYAKQNEEVATPEQEKAKQELDLKLTKWKNQQRAAKALGESEEDIMDESSKAFASTLGDQEKERFDNLPKKDKNTLGKIHALMSKEKKPVKKEEVEIEESRGHSIIASKLAQIASRSSEQGKSPAQIRAEKEKEEKQKQSKLGEGMISYSEFMAKIDESRIDDLRDKQAAEKEAKKDAYEGGEKEKPAAGKRAIKGHSYGADDEANEDEEGKKVAKPEAEKRGRGRPSGSKSGARR